MSRKYFENLLLIDNILEPAISLAETETKYFLRSSMELYRLLVSRLIQPGQKARIVKFIKTAGTGWAGSESVLAVGNTGTVIDFYASEGRIIYHFAPDGQDMRYRSCASYYAIDESFLVPQNPVDTDVVLLTWEREQNGE